MRMSFNPAHGRWQLLTISSFCALEAGATHIDTSVLGSKFTYCSLSWTDTC